jgi:hypothetical protein
VNRYGAQAQRHWQQNFPDRIRELEDAETFFTQLGEDVSETIETMARTLAGAQPPGEGFMQRLQRLNTARAMAESHVLREMVLLETQTTPQ